MLRCYDFIVGRRASDWHTKVEFKDRVSREELTTPLGLLDLLKTEMELMKSQVEIDFSMEARSVIEAIMFNLDNVSNSDKYVESVTNLRELFATLQYLGWNVFLFERQDLTQDVPFATVTGYCYYADSDRVQNMTNVSIAWGASGELSGGSDLQSVVMHFIGNVIQFNNLTSSIIELPSKQKEFEGLAQLGNQYMMNISDVLNMCDHVGYRFQIIY